MTDRKVGGCALTRAACSAQFRPLRLKCYFLPRRGLYRNRPSHMQSHTASKRLDMIVMQITNSADQFARWCVPLREQDILRLKVAVDQWRRAGVQVGHRFGAVRRPSHFCRCRDDGLPPPQKNARTHTHSRTRHHRGAHRTTYTKGRRVHRAHPNKSQGTHEHIPTHTTAVTIWRCDKHLPQSRACPRPRPAYHRRNTPAP